MKLLSRDEFRESVFKRDGHKCVICGADGKDSHHIMERRLFTEPTELGGYFIDNGSTLCSSCHIKAEQTTLSCEDIREAIGIKNPILPNDFYNDNDFKYDKWGNIILPNGKRLKGPLFFDESVQKILDEGGVLNDFSKYVKHPRIFHLPYSEKVTEDDRKLSNDDNFKGQEVVMTLKMDGEQTTMYNDHIHARSLENSSHPSRNWVKGFWSKIAYEIPEGWRICGENVWAKHTISYENLDTFFYMFSIWNEQNVCLSFDETMEWANLLGFQHVPVLYRGTYDKEKIMKAFPKEYDGNMTEGFVIRLAKEYSYKDFKNSVAKFVRKDFEIRHGHWTRDIIKSNELKK